MAHTLPYNLKQARPTPTNGAGKIRIGEALWAQTEGESVPPSILVLDRNQAGCEALCELLQEERYAAVMVTRIEELEPLLRQAEYAILLLDLDSTQATPSLIRSLRRRYPLLQIIGISSRTYHPELEQAMRIDIYACLRKPVDPEELFYVMRAIYKDSFGSRDSPDPEKPG